jgi:hypothetical protein
MLCWELGILLLLKVIPYWSILITLCTTPGCNDFELQLMHLMSHGMTLLMHMGKWLMQQWDGAHVDVHDEVHIVWCTCIWAYDAYAWLMVHMHSERCTKYVHDDAYVDECVMHRLMLMRYGAHDAMSAWLVSPMRLVKVERINIELRSNRCGESHSQKPRYLARS